ncbi:unnamed protein product, partial [Porites evermanni]
SEDQLKISFRTLYRCAYTHLWQVLVMLERNDEALYAAERGRAQALLDALKVTYGLTSLFPSSIESEEEKITDRRGRSIYDPLKYARMEVEMIGKILKSQPLTGEDATKEAVLQGIGLVALVHIAAHGRKETGEIVLAPDPRWESKPLKEEDCIMKMSDIQAVKLRARLVVLSCCHSGQGEVSSEGVVGMARAFLFAGARSVLATLWAIDDEATMMFM